jgi:tetratricopeptide (TPR) repeat protein
LVKAVDAFNNAAHTPFAEFYGFTPVVTQLRFGKWKALLAEPQPPPALTLDASVSLYARGFAHADMGNLKAARSDRAKLAAIVAQGDFKRFEPQAPGKDLAGLSLLLLDAELARKSGHLDQAIALFTRARDIETTLAYTEPPYWHQPVSHLLGAALMQAHRYAEAESVYRDSLTRYRTDGWALFGLAQALKAQGKTDDAAVTRKEFDKAWQLADVKLTSSRF